MESGQKSVAFNLTYQDSSRTLNDEEINMSISNIVAAIEGDFDAKLR